MASVGALRLRLRRRLTWALGSLQTAAATVLGYPNTMSYSEFSEAHNTRHIEELEEAKRYTQRFENKASLFGAAVAAILFLALTCPQWKTEASFTRIYLSVVGILVAPVAIITLVCAIRCRLHFKVRKVIIHESASKKDHQVLFITAFFAGAFTLYAALSILAKALA